MSSKKTEEEISAGVDTAQQIRRNISIKYKNIFKEDLCFKQIMNQVMGSISNNI